MGRLRASWIPAELLPGLLAVGVFLTWAASEGGFLPTTWYPGALFLLGLVAAVVVACPSWISEIPAASRWALGMFAAYVVWSFGSIAWADVPGDAWDGANRALLYFTVFAIFALPSWRPRSAALVFGSYAIGIAVIAAVVVLTTAASDDPLLSFIGGRLAAPTGYHNAAAALFLGAFLPALFLASRKQTPWPCRALLLATAGLLVQAAILPQSRGALIALAIGLLAYLAVVPQRARSVVALLPVAAATAFAGGPILDVYSTIQERGDVGRALDSAAAAMATSFGALLALGTAIALVDRAIRLSPRTTRIAERATAVALVVAIVSGCAAFVAAVGEPMSWAQDRWAEFSRTEGRQEFGSSRFTGGLGSNRYDFWRVSLREFAASPIGMGVDNFAVAYLAERQSNEEPAHPHSLPVRVLSQTGLPGALLFAGFLGAASAPVLRRKRRAANPFGGATACALLVAAGYWLVHSSGDWFWAFPALTAPAFAWLGMAGRIEAPRRSGGGERKMLSRLTLPAGVLLLLLAATSQVLPWMAAREIREAARGWGADPEAAYDRLDRARSLNFFSDRPDLVAGVIASRRGDYGRMRSSFERALRRNSHNWYAMLNLAALDTLRDRREEALERLREAERLNPREPLIRSVSRAARRGQPVRLASIERAFSARVCDLVGRTKATPDCPEQ